MARRERAYRLAGERAREIGILVSVFAPLDAFFQADHASWPAVVALAAGGLILIGAGIKMECDE